MARPFHSHCMPGTKTGETAAGPENLSFQGPPVRFQARQGETGAQHGSLIHVEYLAHQAAQRLGKLHHDHPHETNPLSRCRMIYQHM